MKMKTRVLSLLAAAMAFLSLSAQADNDYQLSNDLSYIRGSIDSRQHIYYPGDTIDIRVSLYGNVSVLAEQQADIYLALFSPAGKASYRRISNYQQQNSQRLYFIEDVTESLLNPGTYQMALIATLPGGDPGKIADWYNGVGGLLETEALMFASTLQDRDQDQDGYWDDDYDRDGFYGDDDSVYQEYKQSKGTYYRSSEYRQWDDEDWSDDADDDWDRDRNLDWNDDDENDDISYEVADDSGDDSDFDSGNDTDTDSDNDSSTDSDNDSGIDTDKD